MQTELRLRKAVDALLDSYHSHPEIQSIGCSGLPARESIVQLANDLQVLLFPGLLRQEQLDAISLPYWLGQKSASIFYRLRDYLEQVICWQSRQEGLPQPPPGACSERAEEISLNLLETLPEMREVLAEDVEATFEVTQPPMIVRKSFWPTLEYTPLAFTGLPTSSTTMKFR